MTYTIDPTISSTNSRVQIKHCCTSRNQYTILNYEKGFVCFDDTVSPMYRSVILDANTHAICAFSPPKSTPMTYDPTSSGLRHHPQTFLVLPVDLRPERPALSLIHMDMDPDTWLVNEIVEGSMVNLWYDRVAGCWEISTKNVVGGEYVYFRNDLSDGSDTTELTNMPFIGKVTYKTMFLDAICEGDIPEINDIMCLNEWDTNYSYSFVLQHPQNHLVLHIDRPRLYLVAVYRVSFPDQPNMVELIYPTTYRTWKWLESCIWVHYPPIVPRMSYTNLLHNYTTIHGSSNVVGVMMTNLKTGTRHKIVSTAYQERKEIRRNNPGVFYQYLCLRYIKKLDDFLIHSPMYVPIFERLNTVVAQFLYNIYRSYQSRYMKRTGETISHRYMPHAYNIHHTMYLPSVSSGKQKITMQSVEQYLNTMSPTELFQALYTV